ncbi:addiction module toxin, RelE/StbE family [Spirochaetia bacterium]|nr:addiction module toxin, RelE/StbE family [Spirochaetia bacterium]
MKNDAHHYELASTGSFKRDLKTIIRRGYDIGLLNDTVDMLLEGKLLPGKYKDHSLIGKWVGYRECHIAFDWLLVYKIDHNTLILTVTRTGTHSDIF